MIRITKKLFDDFAYEEFMCADFKTKTVSGKLIILKLEQTSVKDCKEGSIMDNINVINISNKSFLLNKKVIYENEYRQIYTNKGNSITIDNEKFRLESSIIQEYQGIHSEIYDIIYIFTDKIKNESHRSRDDHNDNNKYMKEVNEEIKYRNNLLLIISKKIMNIILKHVRKNADE